MNTNTDNIILKLTLKIGSTEREFAVEQRKHSRVRHPNNRFNSIL